MYTKKSIELKAKRIERLLTAPEGMEFYFSVYNPGGRQGYQIGWRDKKNGAECPIGYHTHVDGKTLYSFMEGLEVGYDLAKKEKREFPTSEDILNDIRFTIPEEKRHGKCKK